MTKPARICVGKIATSHGVRGWVKVHCYADDPDVLQTCGPLFTSETGDKTLTVKLKTATNTHWLAEVLGVADRDAADRLRGTELYLDRDALPEIDDGYYHADLIGLSVVNDDGATIGVVSALDNFGASDLVEVKPQVGQAFYVPLTDDYATIEIENNRVVIRNYTEFMPGGKADDGTDEKDAEE